MQYAKEHEWEASVSELFKEFNSKIAIWQLENWDLIKADCMINWKHKKWLILEFKWMDWMYWLFIDDKENILNATWYVIKRWKYYEFI